MAMATSRSGSESSADLMGALSLSHFSERFLGFDKFLNLLAGIFVERDLQGLEELGVLIVPTDLAGSLEVVGDLGMIVVFVFAFVEANRCFQNKENVVAGAFDIANCGSNAIRV